MKSTIIALIVCVCCSLSAQVVPTNCDGTIELKEYYRGDAELLAVSLMQNTSWADTPYIAEPFVQGALRWLLAVYNAQGLPARDTVIQCLDIHVDSLIHSVRHLQVWADTGALWAKQLFAGTFPTADPAVNGMVADFGLEVLEQSTIMGNIYFLFFTDKRYNTPALARRFAQIPGVLDATHEYTFGWGWQDITWEIPPIDTFVILTYQHCWGDDICDNTRRWHFHLPLDCALLDFAGSEGQLLDEGICEPMAAPYGSSPEIQFSAYPLPAGDRLMVQINSPIPGGAILLLQSSSGQILLSQKLHLRSEQTDQVQLNTALMPSGIYWLSLRSARQVLTRKIVINARN